MGSGIVDHSFGAILDQEFEKLQTLHEKKSVSSTSQYYHHRASIPCKSVATPPQPYR